jgi:aminopeptidase N
LDAFFSDMLLPHEIAHQWWGNVVTQANYRTAWLMEAMPNYSALEFLEDSKRISARDVVLDSYRRELTTKNDLLPSESAGPVNFGDRLLNNSGVSAWQMIVYEKGTWILHMLRQRLGAEAFRTLQLHMLQQYAAKPITNEDFRRLAAELLPADAPDRDLTLFLILGFMEPAFPN